MSRLDDLAYGVINRRLNQLEEIERRMKRLCDEAEGLAKGEDGEQLKAMVFTKQIRKILAESS